MTWTQRYGHTKYCLCLRNDNGELAHPLYWVVLEMTVILFLGFMVGKNIASWYFQPPAKQHTCQPEHPAKYCPNFGRPIHGTDHTSLKDGL